MHGCVCVLVVVFLGLLLTYSFSLAHIFPYLPGFLAYVSSENRVHPTSLVQRIKFHAKMAINQGSDTHIFFGEEDNHYSTLHNFRRSKKSKWSPYNFAGVYRLYPYGPYHILHMDGSFSQCSAQSSLSRRCQRLATPSRHCRHLTREHLMSSWGYQWSNQKWADMAMSWNWIIVYNTVYTQKNADIKWWCTNKFLTLDILF